jgi:hypothetical protein
MRGTWLRALGAIGVVALVFAGCSSDDKKSDSGSNDSTTSTKAPAKAKPTATATPTTDLADGALVTVTVKDFKSGLTLGINECASTNESEVGQDDCNLSGIKTLTVGADGTGTGTTNVIAGPVGKNAHMCATAGTRCFLSVGELVDSADAQRSDDIDLTFAG